jgi:hypothetical protein
VDLIGPRDHPIDPGPPHRGWVASARERLVDATRAGLMARLKVGDDEAASIVRAALSRMETPLLRRFGRDDAG